MPSRAMLVVMFATLVSFRPSAVVAQGQWTGVGAIGSTAMFMDTTSIVRDGHIRKVWLESVDPEPKRVVIVKDTIAFDTVVGLNVFDCSKHTVEVPTVYYYLRGEATLTIPESKESPHPIKPRSFLDAVYTRSVQGLKRATVLTCVRAAQ